MQLETGLYPVPAGKLASVVTTLEMTEAKYTALLPFPAGVTATRETLSLADYRALFRAIGTPWLWLSRLTLSDAALAEIIHHSDIATFVLRRDDSPIGLIELDYRAPVAALSFFGVVPNETRRGLGLPMMALAQSQAFARPITRLRLTTCTLDAPWALDFYHRHGFQTTARAVEVVDDPRLSGILPPQTAPMHRVLRPDPQDTPHDS